jgi:hypothetical protein
MMMMDQTQAELVARLEEIARQQIEDAVAAGEPREQATARVQAMHLDALERRRRQLIN